MNTRIAYRKAVEILSAFLGSDIEVVEKGRGISRKCVVSTTTHDGQANLHVSPIIERSSWQEVLLDLLPDELIPDRRNPPFNEIGYVSQVYQYRHIGKAIKRDSRNALLSDRAKATDTK